MEMGGEEGTKNLTGKGISEWFLWLGTAAVIGLLAALLLSLSGALEWFG
jgi:hypothetical protein